MNEYPPEEGQWVLISPSGKQHWADHPLKCVRVELNSRVPATVQLARVMAAADEIKDPVFDAAKVFLKVYDTGTLAEQEAAVEALRHAIENP